MSLKLFGIGNPLLDISVEIGKDILDKYELQPANAILAEDKHLPLYAEITDTSKYTVEYVAGGSCQNTIRVAQWLFQQQGATAYSGCVGTDEYAETLTKCARDADGVNVQYQIQSEVPTGTCAVLITDKERSMVANLSAAGKFTIDHLLKPEIESLWKSSQAYYIEGFFLTVTPDSLRLIGEHASVEKKDFGLSLSAPFICQFFTDALKSVLPYSNYVFGNETEAEAAAVAFGFEDKTPKGAAAALSKIPLANGGKRTVVITCGADDVVVAIDGEVQTFAVPALAKDDIVDTNGAGDAFAGGFMYGLVEKQPIAKSVEAGIYASQVILKTSGTKLAGKPTFSF